jgi:phosphoribosylformylglycinamidine synthase subunit PurQ / glutaminase
VGRRRIRLGMIRALVIRSAGTNCDAELCRGFAGAGASVRLEHLDSLVKDPSRVHEFDLIGFPGGFSYGDDVASGRIFAMKARERLYPVLRSAVLRGCPIIGVCNGFQVLVQIGLLPGPNAGEDWPEEYPPAQVCSLTDNKDARFCDRWVGVKYEPQSRCVWTRGLAEACDAIAPGGDASMLPVAHGEGRFVTASPSVLKAIEEGGQVALRYTDNYNGSEGAVAGICDATGRVFGLMPHPDRFLDWHRHPYWTRLEAGVRGGETPGAMMFRNAVEAVAGVTR